VGSLPELGVRCKGDLITMVAVLVVLPLSLLPERVDLGETFPVTGGDVICARGKTGMTCYWWSSIH